jgi:N-formylmaleamate deformylase
MKSWTQGTVQSEAVSLKYYRSGGDKPPVVLVHGFTDSALYFTRLADALAVEWDVIAYDARGHGDSSRLSEAGRFDDEARVTDLVAVITQLGLDRPLVIGHSMGGATIAQAMAQHPGLCRAGILEDPAWWELTEEQIIARRPARTAQIADWTTWVTAIQSMSETDAIAMRTAEEPAWNKVDIAMSLYARRTFDLALFGPFLPEFSPWKEFVTACEEPVLLMIGSLPERNAIITQAQAEEAHELNPLLSWCQVAGAGHHLRYDQFDEYLRQVQQFIKASGIFST